MGYMGTMSEELKRHLERRSIDSKVRLKLIKRLHKVAEAIDEIEHTPSRRCLDEMVTAIQIKLKEFNDE